MYQTITKKIVELGDSLPMHSGNMPDIGKTKQYLTEKDLEIETELKKIINTFPGNHTLYAEELHDALVEDIENESIWIIDPISNTRNFIHGMPHYSVVLSHLYKGEIKFAVVYDPSNKELFTAEKGKGAFLNNQPMHVSNRQKELFFMLGPIDIADVSRKKVLKIISKLWTSDNLRILGSLGLHYAYVACGRIDTAISFNIDTFPEFAGKLLVEEAGGKFTDFNGNALVPETRGIIATNGLIHDQIQDLVNEVV